MFRGYLHGFRQKVTFEISKALILADLFLELVDFFDDFLLVVRV